MTYSIAVAGKGGVGKTLVSGLLGRWLAESGAGPVLAVDADANANLHEVLGFERGESVGAIREEMKALANKMPAGMTKSEFLEYKVEMSLVESASLDLLVMGRPEGPGCYCYANNLLREILGQIANRYRYVVIDNEAGMEHLSRRLIQRIDLLLLISDPSLRGIDTAIRMSHVPEEVETRVVKKTLVINRAKSLELPPAAEQRIADGSLSLAGVIQEDPWVARCDQELGDLFVLYPSSEMAKRVVKIGESLGLAPKNKKAKA